MLTIRPAALSDAPAITAIYNQGIADRAATFETEPRTVQELETRLADTSRYPLLVVAADDGVVIGWASTSSYRSRACYAGIAEFSVYLARDARGKGVGRQLLAALVDAARAVGYWKLVSRVFTFNVASLSMCKHAGFREVGIYEKHGQLEGRWLDVVVVERLIAENLTATLSASLV